MFPTGIWVKTARWTAPRELLMGPHGGLYSINPDTRNTSRLSAASRTEVERIPGFKGQKKALLKAFRRIEREDPLGL